MSRTVKMPALSPTMERGTLARWLVKKGQNVRAGDALAEIETDKAIMEVEAPDDGTILELLLPDGKEDVLVNTPIARMTGEENHLSSAPLFPASENTASGHTASGNTQNPSQTFPADVLPVYDTSQNVENRQTNKAKVFPKAVRERWKGKSAIKTVREAIRDVLAQEMRRDKRIFLLGEEIGEYQGAYKVTENLLEEFGALRVIDTPISEHAFAGMAVGAAFVGLHPVVEFMTFNFGMQAMDHLINSAAKTHYMSGGVLSCPVIFRGPNGSSARAAAQHSQDFSSWFAHVPGLIVLAPYDAADATGLLRWALRCGNPVIFLENEVLYGHRSPVPLDADYIVEPGSCDVCYQGEDCTLVSYGRAMEVALSAYKVLKEENCLCDVVNLRSLRPLDWDGIFASVRKTGRIVIVEEGWPVGGIGAEIAAKVGASCFDDLDAPPMRISAKDVPMPYASNLERLSMPQVEDVIRTVKALCYQG